MGSGEVPVYVNFCCVASTMHQHSAVRLLMGNWCTKSSQASPLCICIYLNWSPPCCRWTEVSACSITLSYGLMFSNGSSSRFSFLNSPVVTWNLLTFQTKGRDLGQLQLSFKVRSPELSCLSCLSIWKVKEKYTGGVQIQVNLNEIIDSSMNLIELWKDCGSYSSFPKLYWRWIRGLYEPWIAGIL